MHFLNNFDPETSARERRKINRKSYFMKSVSSSRKSKSKSIYNESGHIAATGKDLCDCLDEKCPGCHFPCPKCSSNKCGHDCRVNRKWMVDKIEIEAQQHECKGATTVYISPFSQPFPLKHAKKLTADFEAKYYKPICI